MGRNFNTIRPAYGLLCDQNLARFDPTQLNHEYLPKPRPSPLGHPDPLSIRLTPAIVTTGRDFNTIRPAYGLFVIRTWPGSIPRNLIMSISQSPGLNHSAILSPFFNLVYASHSNDGT